MPVIRVLLVEDELDIQFIVKAALERNPGFLVQAFETGDAALEHARQAAEIYDLALVNFRLPGMDGIDFIRSLREMPGYENVPAVLISAALLDPELIAAKKGEFLGVIPKPFSALALPTTLLELITGAGK